MWCGQRSSTSGWMRSTSSKPPVIRPWPGSRPGHSRAVLRYGQVIETIWLPFTISTDTLIVCAVSGPTTDTLFLVNQTRCDSLGSASTSTPILQATWLLTDETCGYANGEIEVTDVQGGCCPTPPVARRTRQTDGSFLAATRQL